MGLTLPPSRTGLGDVAALDEGVVAAGGAGVEEVLTGALLVGTVLAVVVLGGVVLAVDDDCVGGGVMEDGGVVGGTLLVGIVQDDGTDDVLAGVEVLVRVGAVVADVEVDRVFGCDFDFDADADVDTGADDEADVAVERVVDIVDVVDDAGAVVVAGMFAAVISPVTAAMSAWMRCPCASDTDWVDCAAARSRLSTPSADSAAV